MLADLVTGFLARVGDGLEARPFTPRDQAVVDSDLLDPVLPVSPPSRGSRVRLAHKTSARAPQPPWVQPPEILNETRMSRGHRVEGLHLPSPPERHFRCPVKCRRARAVVLGRVELGRGGWGGADEARTPWRRGNQ